MCQDSIVTFVLTFGFCMQGIDSALASPQDISMLNIQSTGTFVPHLRHFVHSLLNFQIWRKVWYARKSAFRHVHLRYLSEGVRSGLDLCIHCIQKKFVHVRIRRGQRQQMQREMVVGAIPAKI